MQKNLGWFGASFGIGCAMAALTVVSFFGMVTFDRHFKLNQVTYSDQMVYSVMLIGFPIVAGMGLVLGACWNSERRVTTACCASIMMAFVYVLLLFAVKIVYTHNGPLM